MVLQDGAVEGRRVFGNITKYIKMGASSNFGNMFSVLGASIFLPFLPMTAIQVLTNNLLYDFSQTTIPTDNVDEEYLTIPRKWDIDNIFKFMIFIGPISSISITPPFSSCSTSSILGQTRLSSRPAGSRNRGFFCVAIRVSVSGLSMPTKIAKKFAAFIMVSNCSSSARFIEASVENWNG